jgi:hypothetical protein
MGGRFASTDDALFLWDRPALKRSAYSYRSADIGSVRNARRAGRQDEILRRPLRPRFPLQANHGTFIG